MSTHNISFCREIRKYQYFWKKPAIWSYVFNKTYNFNSFLFFRWMDTGCDDRKLSRELYPLSRYPMEYEPPSKYLRLTGEVYFLSLFHIRINQIFCLL